jgi:hypothetical protein
MKKYVQEKEFNVAGLMIRLVSIGFIIALTIVCLAAPLLDAVDKWCDDPDNQIIIGCVSTGVLLAFGVKWFVNKLRG